MDPMKKLQIEHLCKTYKKKNALSDVSFTLQRGIYGLLGENGAGKSTLMRLLATVDFPTKGKIRYGETDIFDMDGEYRSLIGYMPQDYNVYPGFTAKEFLEYMGVLKGIPERKLKDRIREVLEFVNLSDAADKKVKNFSGGMKRRIGIAQAMINEPEILCKTANSNLHQPHIFISSKLKTAAGSLLKSRFLSLFLHLIVSGQ